MRVLRREKLAADRNSRSPNKTLTRARERLGPKGLKTLKKIAHIYNLETRLMDDSGAEFLVNSRTIFSLSLNRNIYLSSETGLKRSGTGDPPLSNFISDFCLKSDGNSDKRRLRQRKVPMLYRLL